MHEKYDPSQPRVPAGTQTGGQWTSGGSSGLATDYKPPNFITNLQGQRIKPPREFYRGQREGSTRRITTGEDEWDSYLFVSDTEKYARDYGGTITRVIAKPGAKILYEGTKDYNQLAKGAPSGYFDRVRTVAKKAHEEGFDAVWFKRQGDTGTAIFNRVAFDVQS
jgi:hypothetical protein